MNQSSNGHRPRNCTNCSPTSLLKLIQSLGLFLYYLLFGLFFNLFWFLFLPKDFAKKTFLLFDFNLLLNLGHLFRIRTVLFMFFFMLLLKFFVFLQRFHDFREVSFRNLVSILQFCADVNIVRLFFFLFSSHSFFIIYDKLPDVKPQKVLFKME